MKTVLTLDDLHFDADGCVWARPYLAYDPVRRRPVRPYHKIAAGGFDGPDDALAQMNRWWELQAPAGRHRVGATVSGMLDAWLRSAAKGWKPGGRTAADYASKVRLHVVPYIGHVGARDLDPPEVDDLYDALLESGGRGGRGLSPATVIVVHRVLSRAYRWGVARGFADYSPMDYVTKPRAEQREAVAFGREDAAALMRAFLESQGQASTAPRAFAARNQLFAAYLSLMTGLRLGEVCALRRCDVRVGAGGASVHVGATMTETGGLRRVESPKTSSSRRNVPLAEQVAEAVGAHVAWCDGPDGPRGPRPGEAPLCCMPGFAWLRPSATSARFSRLRDELGLPRASSFHSLRHTFATWQLESGAPVHEVSALLGHSSEAVTLGVYAHVMPGRGAEITGGYVRDLYGRG